MMPIKKAVTNKNRKVIESSIYRPCLELLRSYIAEPQKYFERTDHAFLYQKYRPTTPRKVIDKVVNFLKEKHQPPFEHAVDVGCGSGQSTCLLADYFEHVTGYDVSEAQVCEANRTTTNNNVVYRIGQSEALGLSDNSVELITAGNSAHWFNLAEFFKEAKRVLVPGGVLALYGNALPTFQYLGSVRPEMTTINNNHVPINDSLMKFLSKNVFQCATDRTNHMMTQYANIAVPFDEVVCYRNDGAITETVDMTLAEVLGYIQSWSSFQIYIEQNPEKKDSIIEELTESILDSVGIQSVSANNVLLKVVWPYFLIMARKPVK